MKIERPFSSVQNEMADLYGQPYAPHPDLRSWIPAIEEEVRLIKEFLESKKPFKDQNVRKSMLRLASICFRALYSKKP
jgi:hypothetical protein